MLRTLNADRASFMSLTTNNEGLFNRINTFINNINVQICVISMELLRKFNVKLVNIHKKHTITQYGLEKVLLDRFPGNFITVIKNSYGLFMGRLARG